MLKLEMMDEIVKINVLRHEKSTFRFELIKPENGPLYLSIEQMIDSLISRPENPKLRIRASFLKEIIETLHGLQYFVKPSVVLRRRFLKEENKEELISRYFKGLEIDTLAIQFDCSVKEIIQLFRSRNIAVTSNQMPTPAKYKFQSKRKRRY